MPPLSDKKLRSTIGIKNSSHRDSLDKNVSKWLDAKRAADGAENLWRVHNGLYDLTDFVDGHPGGKFWLEATKGTDITEAFESHHISTKPEHMLKSFYIREAKESRASAYTFKDDGFYRTLKAEVREALKTLPKDIHKRTNFTTDCLAAATFILGVLACLFWSYTLGFISGIVCGAVIVAAHNYAHRRDNFRMYYMDCFMFQSRGFRIVHVLSHHLYTNTVADLQAYINEPLYVYFPQKKSWITKYASAIYMPLLLWPVYFSFTTIARLIATALKPDDRPPFCKADLLPLIFPVTMYLMGGQSLFATVWMWQFIIAIASCFFSYLAYTGGHYHPDLFMDGDTPRSEEEMDWGICQLDTVYDCYEIVGNHLRSLVLFGDHALHHLFPTFDSGVLEFLYPTVEKVMEKYNLKIRMMRQARMYQAYLRQVAREDPNPNPPDLNKELD